MTTCVNESSFGIIPLRSSKGCWEVLLVQHRLGQHFGFPKGHAMQGELPEQAAERELLEETGLVIAKWMPHMVFREAYTFSARGKQVYKTVVYFVAEVSGTFCLQECEISKAVWVPLNEAQALLTYPQAREIVSRLASELLSL